MELHLDAFPLGVRPESEYGVVEINLDPGDRVVFCSDGIIEAENGIEEMFGFERTAEAISRAAGLGTGSKEFIEHLLSEVDAFCGNAEQGDDQTIIVLGAK